MIARLIILLIVAGAGLGPGRLRADDSATEPVTTFDQQSLALRTELFHEPSLEQPLKSLIELYRKAGKIDELVGLYRGHVSQYPDDAGSQAVMVRLLLELKSPEASAAAQVAVEAHPGHALTLFLRHLDLESRRDPRSLEVLSQAVEKETDPSRKRAWVEKLVTAAVAVDRRDLAEKPLRDLAGAEGQTADSLAALAQRMNRDRFFELALETLKLAAARQPSPETSVEIELQSATAEAGLGKPVEASARIEALLKRVAPEYARRPEIIARRVALLRSDAEREALLKAARASFAANPKSEAAALDLAELLVACELRREALKVLRDAGAALPQSERIELAALALLDRLGDERGVRDFLAPRLAALPPGVERPDLVYRLVRSLFALGAAPEAEREFERLLATLAPADRLTRRIELGRSLRRMSLPVAAAGQFQRALSEEPKRLDVRREAAEALMAAGDAGGARRMMQQALDATAETENLLDVVAFMVQQNLLTEARDALRTRLARDPLQFEVAIALVDVLAKLGEQKDGHDALDQARRLADTDARYRRWIEAAQAFAETMGTTEELFSAEQARLVAEADETAGGWTPARATRYLTFCEVTRHATTEPTLIEAIGERLDAAELPTELRVSLRRLLVEAMRSDPKNAVEVRNQLQHLATEDAGRADEYHLRLARATQEAMHQGGGRSDQVRELLQEIDPARIADGSLLRGAHRLFLDYGIEDKAMAVLERLTELEPGDRGHWERWITALAGTANEERLRAALRRLLSGVMKTPLDDQTIELLRGHAVDSCWRSAAAAIALDDPARLTDVFLLLDEIERTAAPGADRLWVIWTRGWALRNLGRIEAATEAAAEFEAAAREPAASGQPAAEVVFPDGLAMAMDKAIALLRDTAQPAPWPAEPAEGPARPPQMRWGFRTDGAVAVVQVHPFADTVLVLDEAGTLYQLEAATGKLRWRVNSLWEPLRVPQAVVRPGGRSGRPSALFRGGTPVNGVMSEVGQIVSVAPRFALDVDAARLFLCRDGRLSAMSAADGSLLWRSEIGGVSRVSAPPPGMPGSTPLADHVFLDPIDRVVVWRPETATASAFHPASGKLLWTRDLPAEPTDLPPSPLNAGAACADGLLLVFGQKPCVLDTATGATIWSFVASGVREFPLELNTVQSAAYSTASVPAGQFAVGMGTGAPGLPASLAARARRLALNHLRPPGESSVGLGQWLDNKGQLVAPAVAWAEERQLPLGGQIVRGRLVLSLPGVVIAPSLALPLAGPRFGSGGTFVGATATRAIFQTHNSLQICDLARGGAVSVPLDAVGSTTGTAAPEAVVAGPRVFVTGEKGLLCLNPLTQQILYSAPWPPDVVRFTGLADPPDTDPSLPAAPGFPSGAVRQVQFAPQHIVRAGTSGLAMAAPPRHAARGTTLYAVIGIDKVVALSDEPEASAPAR